MSQKKSADPSEPSPIGNRNTPMVRRFKRSGKRKGRPNGAKNRKTIVNTVANEMHSIVEDGKPVRRSTLELVLLRLRNMALEGKSPQAFEEIHKLLEICAPAPTGPALAYAIMPAPLSMDEFLNVIERDHELMEKYGVRTIAEAREMEREEMRKKEEQE